MKPFSGRGGSRNLHITPNNRTGVKRRGQVCHAEMLKREWGESSQPTWAVFGSAEPWVWGFFITRQELSSPLSSSKTFSLKFNGLDLGQPLLRMLPSCGIPIWMSLFMGRITHQETFFFFFNFQDLRNLFSLFQLKQLMARWTHPFTKKPRG